MNERIPAGFHPIDAYTNGYVIIVIGELQHSSSLWHNCDEMGCGSLDHVIARIPVLEPTPELHWGKETTHAPTTD